MFTESLTVRILGDSSDLQRELEGVLSQLDDFQSRLSDVGDSGRALSEGLSRTEGAATSLQQMSTLLGGVEQQAQQLSRQSISLNVQPAIAALAQLSAAIQATAAQLAALQGQASVAAAGEVAAPLRMAGAEGLASGEGAIATASSELIAAPTTSLGGAARTGSTSSGSPTTTSNHFG